MPTYEYRARDSGRACSRCRDGFECFRRLADAPLTQCPDCGAELVRVWTPPYVARSTQALDDGARRAGFHKFKRIGRGEYEKAY